MIASRHDIQHERGLSHVTQVRYLPLGTRGNRQGSRSDQAGS
jgi:hypothetical protein